MAIAHENPIRPMPRLSTASAIRPNPIDTFSRIATAEGYRFEREDLNSLHVELHGVHCNFELSLSWNPADENLALFILFDGRIPGGRTDEICRLLSLLNERLIAGHFDLWNSTKGLVYRHAISLKGGATLSTDQAMDVTAQALDAAEKGYPAAQYVIWAGKSPEDAVAEALVDFAAQR
jgi:hypothetical protein